MDSIQSGRLEDIRDYDGHSSYQDTRQKHCACRALPTVASTTDQTVQSLQSQRQVAIESALAELKSRLRQMDLQTTSSAVSHDQDPSADNLLRQNRCAGDRSDVESPLKPWQLPKLEARNFLLTPPSTSQKQTTISPRAAQRVSSAYVSPRYASTPGLSAMTEQGNTIPAGLAPQTQIFELEPLSARPKPRQCGRLKLRRKRQANVTNS